MLILGRKVGDAIHIGDGFEPGGLWITTRDALYWARRESFRNPDWTERHAAAFDTEVVGGGDQCYAAR